jgi:hypothetical protein
LEQAFSIFIAACPCIFGISDYICTPQSKKKRSLKIPKGEIKQHPRSDTRHLHGKAARSSRPTAIRSYQLPQLNKNEKVFIESLEIKNNFLLLRPASEKTVTH